MNFEFITSGRIIFGPGGIRQIASFVRTLGTRALFVTGRSARTQSVANSLQLAGIQTSMFCVPGEPTVEMVRAGIEQARILGADIVVSIGGGSAIDAGKAISAMLTNPGNILDYLEVIGSGKPITITPAPFIAVPTTAGTGSEVTRNAVLGSPEHRVKVSLRSPMMLPRVAIIDPELTYGLHPNVTASTGMDALTQLIEPYVCLRPNPMVDPLCAAAIPQVSRALSHLQRHGENPSAREAMALASLFGGLALANAGLGAVHGFAGPLGGMYPAPHGAVCAALLPHVMKANIEALRKEPIRAGTLARYTEIARMLTGNPEAQAEDGANWTHNFVQELGIPKLSTYGVRPEAIPDIVEKSSKASSMKFNPISLSHDELGKILNAAL